MYTRLSTKPWLINENGHIVNDSWLNKVIDNMPIFSNFSLSLFWWFQNWGLFDPKPPSQFDLLTSYLGGEVLQLVVAAVQAGQAPQGADSPG